MHFPWWPNEIPRCPLGRSLATKGQSAGLVVEAQPVDSRSTLILGSEMPWVGLSSLSGRPPVSTAEKLTLGHELGVRNVRETLPALGPDPCSVAVARRELRLARPGCDLQPAKGVLHTEGSGAVPCDAVKANLEPVLTGRKKTCGFIGRITFCVVMSRRGAPCGPILIHDSRALNDSTLGVVDASGASGYD